MAAITGYIDSRSEEKKASGKVWRKQGFYIQMKMENCCKIHIMHNIQYILRGNCGRGREEKEGGEAEEK